MNKILLTIFLAAIACSLYAQKTYWFTATKIIVDNRVSPQEYSVQFNIEQNNTYLRVYLPTDITPIFYFDWNKRKVNNQGQIGVAAKDGQGYPYIIVFMPNKIVIGYDDDKLSFVMHVFIKEDILKTLNNIQF